MLKYQNLTLVGTNHVSEKSVLEIKDTIRQGFSAVAIELDSKRLYSLLNPSKQNEKIDFSVIFKVGLNGFLFALLGRYVQKKIGAKLNVKPGSDMLEAYKQAKEYDCKIFLIDQDIDIVLKKISKEIKFKEKLKFIFDLFSSLIFPKKYIKKYGLDNFNLDSVPSQEIIDKLLFAMSNDYPSVYKILVEDRNKLMAKRLYKIMNTHNSVLGVVGAGHETEIIDILKNLYKKNTDFF